VPVPSNGFLEYILRGTYGPDRRPAWLREENQPRLRRLLPRVRIVSDRIERFLAAAGERAFDKHALSDVFEYMSVDESDRLFRGLWHASRDGARISYREMMVPRVRPSWLRDVLVEDEELGALCHRQDRSFFYGAHHVLTVRRNGEGSR
jgi:S-adenosylmethionine-diacylglycerol 3-amino-3-carboxypropyl transferase